MHFIFFYDKMLLVVLPLCVPLSEIKTKGVTTKINIQLDSDLFKMNFFK